MILIYDIEGAHYNKVKSTFDYYYEGNDPVIRYFSDFSSFTVNQDLEDFVTTNDIKVVIIPYYSISPNKFRNIIDADAICVIPYFVGYFGAVDGKQRAFQSTIRIAGGVNEATSHNVTKQGLDFYSECSNLTGDDRTAPSYVCAKIGALIANLIDDGYSVWQARQILRQNADSYDNWTRANGFGKVPDSITIPDTIEKIHPVDVLITTAPVQTDKAFSLADSDDEIGYLNYRSIDGNLESTGYELSISSTPYEIDGDGNEYTMDFRNDYGGDFTKYTFQLNAMDVEPEPDPEPEPDIEPITDPTKPTATRSGSEITVTRNETTATAKVYRKLRENDEWELVGETTEESFTDEIDPAKNYIYAIRLSNSETESALSEATYVTGYKETSTVSQAIL